MTTWIQVLISVFAGAAAWELPRWRARRRLCKRLMEAKHPTQAVTLALVSAGLDAEQAGGILAAFHEESRGTYWDTMQLLFNPPAARESWTIRPDGQAAWGPDNSDGPQLGG